MQRGGLGPSEIWLGLPGSLSHVDCEVEALDELCIFYASHEQFSHLHLQEVLWQPTELFLVDLQLHAKLRRGCRAHFEHSWQAEESHTVED